MTETYEAARDQILTGLRDGATLTLDVRDDDALAELSFPAESLLYRRITQEVLKRLCLDNLICMDKDGERVTYVLTKRGRDMAGPSSVPMPRGTTIELNPTRDVRQQVVAYWCADAFGTDQATNLPQRGIRLLEEAIELAQACGCDRDMALRLVRFVFGRPVGTIGQELGGVGVTVLALAAAAGLSAEQEEAREVERVLDKPLVQFTERNKAKNAAGFKAIDGPTTMLVPDDLPPPDAVIDYGGGIIGPVMLHWLVEGQDAEHVAREAGFDCMWLPMDEDLDHDDPIHVGHFEYGVDSEITLTKWQPTDPGNGWKLVGKHDTEEGPVALWVRPSAVNKDAGTKPTVGDQVGG